MGFRIGWWGKLGGVTMGKSGPRGYLFGRGCGCVLLLLPLPALLLLALLCL